MLARFDSSSPLYFTSETDIAHNRVVLKRKKYNILVKIVASDTRQSSWEIELDPASHPRTIRRPVRLSVPQYEGRLLVYKAEYESKK